MAYLSLLELKRFKENRLTIREAADYLGVSTRTLQRWEDPEKAPEHIPLEPHRIGKRVWYTTDDIAECLRQRDMRRERLREGGRTRRRARA